MRLTGRHTNLTRSISIETQRYAKHRVSALDPLPDVSPVGRNRPRDGAWRAQYARSGAYPGRLAVWNAGARRAAIGIYHHAPRVDLWDGDPHTAHDGSGICRRQDRPRLQRSLLLGLGELRALRDLVILPHPLGARTVEPAMGPVPAVQ